MRTFVGNHRVRCFIVLVSSCLGACCSAWADSSNDQDSQLQEVIVTAQRREEAVEKVPISMTVLSQRTMDDLQIEKLADLATIVPGIFFPPPNAAGQDYNPLSIRGIATGNGAPTNQFYIDETPISVRQNGLAGNTYSPEPLIFDLDRVEVLRGPQGTLFGSSAMGGAIRFITPAPNLTDSNGFAKADIADTDRGAPNYEVGAAYGAPILDSVLGFRVSAWFQSLGGFINQVDPLTGDVLERNINSSSSYVIRPAFSWVAAGGLTITPALYLQHKESNSPNSYWINGLPESDNGKKNWGGAPQPLTDDLRVGSLGIKYSGAGFDINSDSSYLYRQEKAVDDFTPVLVWDISHNSPNIPAGTDFIPGVSSPVYDGGITNAYMQEFRISSNVPNSRIDWVAGLFYRHAVEQQEQLVANDLTPLTEATYSLTSLQFFGQIPNYLYQGKTLNAFANFYTTDISEAAFASLTLNITSRLKADLGVRVEHTIVEDQEQTLDGPLNGGYYHAVLPDQVGNPVTPRASLTYQYTDNNMVYASASKGYRSGGGNAPSVIANPACQASARALGFDSVPASYGSDNLWSYEVGAKSLLFEKRLSIQGSIYYITWKNIQSGLYLPSCNFGSFTANFGEQISQGADLQAEALITDGLKVRALAGYNNVYIPNTLYGAPVDGVRPVLAVAGQKGGYQPLSVALNGDYSRDTSAIWADSRSYIRMDFRYLSAEPEFNPAQPGYDPEQAAHINQAYGTLNARVGVTKGGLDLSLYANNLTNADPLLAWYHGAVGDPLWRANQLPPRTMGATVWYRF